MYGNKRLGNLGSYILFDSTEYKQKIFEYSKKFLEQKRAVIIIIENYKKLEDLKDFFVDQGISIKNISILEEKTE